MMKLTKLTIVVSLALVAVLGAVTLARAPARVVRTSPHGVEVVIAAVGDAAVCQSGEVLPAGVSAVRIWLEAEIGPPVRVQVYSRGRLLSEGRRGAGWTASAVTVPVAPLRRTASNVKVCFAAKPNSERLQLYGINTAPGDAATTANGHPLAGRMTVEYLAPGSGSWFSRALGVARHMGIGRAVSGTWLALLVAALMAGVLVVATCTAWRELP
jgi:hypothetical protein